MKPLCIDIYAGLGGWAHGFLAEGYDVVGFDIERHVYGDDKYPGQLVIQDALTLHGKQFSKATIIVASPPCQQYSYRAMPWKRAKALPPPDNSLFEACFRIQREAIEATRKNCGACMGTGELPRRIPGYHEIKPIEISPCSYCKGVGFIQRHIPLIVENVKGANPWVGRAKWHYGSFYLWGDVPALMPITFSGLKLPGNNGPRLWADRKVQRLCDATKNASNGTWFGKSHGKEYPGQPGNGRDGVKVPGMNWSDRSRPAQGFNMEAQKRFGRKAASAHIAKIPFPLSSHIARVFKESQMPDRSKE